MILYDKEIFAFHDDDHGLSKLPHHSIKKL